MNSTGQRNTRLTVDLTADEIWGDKYPAIRGLWNNAWEEFIPFLDHSPEIRRMIYRGNAIESLNARFRRATSLQFREVDDIVWTDSGSWATPCSVGGRPWVRFLDDSWLMAVLRIDVLVGLEGRRCWWSWGWWNSA